jgi:hypothetical protein
MGYSVIHVDDLEPAGPGGAVRFVRRALGVEAFAINWFVLPHEEVYVVVRGSGVRRVDGQEVPVREDRVPRGSYVARGPF